jgi:hypothetical protein
MVKRAMNLVFEPFTGLIVKSGNQVHSPNHHLAGYKMLRGFCE